MCMCVHACVRTYKQGRGNKGSPLKLLLVLHFDVMAGLVHTHTHLRCFDTSVPHRQDFKGNFQAPPLPSPGGLEQGRGEAGREWRSRGVSCERRRWDHHGQHRHRSWLSMDRRTGSRPAFVFQVDGRCYTSAAGSPDVQMDVLTGGSRR